MCYFLLVPKYAFVAEKQYLAPMNDSAVLSSLSKIGVVIHPSQVDGPGWRVLVGEEKTGEFGPHSLATELLIQVEDECFIFDVIAHIESELGSLFVVE